MKVGGVLVLSLMFLSAMGQLPSQDILALLEFRKGIKRDPTGYVIDSWNDESIDFNGCPSSWNGIVCNGGNVAGVVLDNLGLSAEADLSVFANLTKLVKLSMANNSISGKFPDNIADFESLEYLDLSNNLFSSPLPPGIGKLHGLKSLSLGSNNFSGTIPDEIAGLASVRSVDLSANSFSGAIPDSLAKMSALVSLNLSGNGFTKTLPKGLDLLSSLNVIDLTGNMLEGRLDAEFLLSTGASHVDLSGNMFTSSDPRRVLSRISETVKYLNLSRNRLTGSLVSSGEIFESLKVLDLSYNGLSGELPGFSFVYDLQVLKLSNNGFSGEIPNNLLKGDTLVLTELDLSSNNLSGPISMITSTNLRVLNLSSNGLSGDLPMLTGSCEVLDLSNNGFQGNLTRMLKWGDIEFLDLSRNRLTGPILESSTPQFLRLNHLNLSHNSLTGPLPKAMTRYPKLRALDLSSNGFNGPFLESWVTMPALEEFRLDHNSLTGPIELSSPLPSDSKLQILDLSNNRLAGFFPGQLGSTPIQSLSIAGNNFSGSLPTSIASMTSLTSLDISTNRFTGPLPENLPGSLASFNTSYNDLSGVVPENLRRFPPSSFFPGNSHLQFPGSPPGVGSGNSNNNKRTKKPINTLVKVVIAVSCVAIIVVLLLLAIFLHYLCVTRRDSSSESATEKKPNPSQALTTVSAADLKVSSASEPRATMMSSSDEKASPSKSGGGGSQVSWSPERLAGELYFLDDTIGLTAEELSRAPAEVLGRSSHGTSYRASLDDGGFLTVKWLREGVAKQKKEFGKEAKKFTNIRHPNVVGLKGYYWGPSQHEKLILSDYISPGSLASFLYDKPGRQGPPLTWAQRLKIAVDVARGLNYLHFDRAVPHGNLKATNVLLDGPDLNARVADYCLHRLMTQAGTVEQILDSGVLGYRAPELAGSKKPVPSFKSDVYAFGVVLLELLTARPADADLAEWVRAHPTDCFDAPLAAEMAESPAAEKGVREALAIALRCLRSVSDRPGIKTVYEDLSSI